MREAQRERVCLLADMGVGYMVHPSINPSYYNDGKLYGGMLMYDYRHMSVSRVLRVRARSWAMICPF